MLKIIITRLVVLGVFWGFLLSPALGRGFSDKESCEYDCLFLTLEPWEKLFGEVNDRYCRICQKYTDWQDACDLVWPGSQDALDSNGCQYLVNCIYAANGYPFKKAHIRKEFEKTTWYHADPQFTPARLSPLEKANIEKIKKRCAELHGR